jgi:DNA-binding transcriptional LysR family regulator
MELRHLRYFIAVAEEGSLTTAAERRLHTAQPSLSRQIRDLELKVGVKLLERGARGITLTTAGRVFLDHARLALLQVEAAGRGVVILGTTGAHGGHGGSAPYGIMTLQPPLPTLRAVASRRRDKPLRRL